jgi:murein DD-endopeptidase MepM/ murein hydrolase activator NlpD
MRIKYLFVLFFTLPFLYAQEAYNGTTALFEFSKIPQDAQLFYESKKIPLLTHPLHVEQKFAIIPINYRSSFGDKNLTVTYRDGSTALALHVSKKAYPFETITVTPSKVTPNKKQKERTTREYNEAMKVYRTTTPTRYWNKPFIYPLDSKITSDFGTARMFNNSLKSFHSGTDFRAKVGTPIYATNDGVIVIAKNRYYAGNSVVIDHGEGIYSCYYHLSTLHVKLGEKVKQGDKLGLSGATGRVSGPHLHYAMMVQGIQVNPLQFHEKINSLFQEE